MSQPTLKPLLISVAIAIVMIELLSLTAFRLGLFGKGVFSGPTNIAAGNFSTYLAERDPLLGWPTRQALADRFTGSGYRISPVIDRLISESAPCLAVYGDSLAFGSEVEDGETWTDALTEKLGCPVLNFGVPGYATDQSVLRFEQVHPEGLPALLTFTEINLARNRSQIFDIWSGPINLWTSKPRFSLTEDGEQLELIGLPVNDPSQLPLLQDAARIDEALMHEDFLPDRSAWSAVSAQFPYTLSGWRHLRNRLHRKSWERERYGLSPGWARLFRRAGDADPLTTAPSIALQTRILERFINRCASLKLECRILMLPVIPDLVAQTSTGRRLVQTLRDEPLLGPHFIELDSECLLEQIPDRSRYTLAGLKQPGGHYNPTLNQHVGTCLKPLLEPVTAVD